MNSVVDTLLPGQGRVTVESAAAGTTSLRIASALQRLVFYGLLLVIALTAIPYGTVEPWWVAAFECLVFILAIFATIEAFVDRRPRDNYLALAMPLIALTIFIFLQSAPLFSTGNLSGSVSVDPYNSRLFAVKLVALVITGALLARYCCTRSRLRALVLGVIVIGFASALFALVRKSTQTGPTFFLPHLIIDDAQFGVFINKNHFAFLMEMTLGLTLGVMVMGFKDRRRLILLPIAALVWMALVMSNSRGGILGSLCELLFLGAMLDPIGRLTRGSAEHDRKPLPSVAGAFVLRGFLVVCLLVLFGYGVAWIGGEPVVNNFASATNDFGRSGALNNANTSRKQMWSITWNAFRAHPLVGIGFGAYWIGITRYHNASGELTPQQAHNDYLDLLAAGGLIGFALVSWFALVFISRARERLRSPDSLCRGAVLGSLTGIFGVALHSFVDFGLHVTINALVFTMLIVIATVSIPPAGQASGISARDQESEP